MHKAAAVVSTLLGLAFQVALAFAASPIIAQGSLVQSKVDALHPQRVLYSFRLPGNMSGEDVRVVYLRIEAGCRGEMGASSIVKGQAFCELLVDSKTKTVSTSDPFALSTLSDTLVARGDPCGDGALYLGVSPYVRCAFEHGQNSLLIALEPFGNMQLKTGDVCLYFHNDAYPAGSTILVVPYGQ